MRTLMNLPKMLIKLSLLVVMGVLLAACSSDADPTTESINQAPADSGQVVAESINESGDTGS